MDTKMNLVVISTDALLTPPTAYGGIELQAWLGVKGLSERGHRVHLIAKEGSQVPPNGNLYPYEGNRQLAKAVEDILKTETIDCWIDETHGKILTEMMPELPQLTRYEVMSLMGDPRCPVLISEGQRREKFNNEPWPIIPQAIDLGALPYYVGPRENYLLYAGQKITEKRIEWACEAAIGANIPLYIHGPGWGQKECHDRIAAYALRYPDLIHNEGEIGGKEKLSKLQRAKALIHLPGANGWSEAGGIVVLEALATGTPCIVSGNGCLDQYVQNGLNGFVINSVEEAIDAIRKIDSIDPERCTVGVEEYDYRIVAHHYEALCRRIARGEQWR
jgi:glycosyltransferase involved in cell wall biosynthesis